MHPTAWHRRDLRLTCPGAACVRQKRAFRSAGSPYEGHRPHLWPSLSPSGALLPSAPRAVVPVAFSWRAPRNWQRCDGVGIGRALEGPWRVVRARVALSPSFSLAAAASAASAQGPPASVLALRLAAAAPAGSGSRMSGGAGADAAKMQTQQHARTRKSAGCWSGAPGVSAALPPRLPEHRRHLQSRRTTAQALILQYISAASTGLPMSAKKSHRRCRETGASLTSETGPATAVFGTKAVAGFVRCQRSYSTRYVGAPVENPRM